MAVTDTTDSGGTNTSTKNTTSDIGVIPSTIRPGTYSVSYNGYTYRYQVYGSVYGKNDQNIVFFNNPLEQVNELGNVLVSDESKITTWVPPTSFFPPNTNVVVETYTPVMDMAKYNGGVPDDHRLVDKQFTTPKKKKKKEKESLPGNPPVMTIDDFGIGRFNPPPHNSSRTLPPTAFPNYSTLDPANNSIFTQLESLNQRGFFYQDFDTAIDSTGKQKKKSELWGFQFMYNPTTISYTNQINTNIDQTNLNDVANQLVGSQSMTFDILINRVADISALRDSYTSWISRSIMDTYGLNDGYPRSLTSDEIIGLYRRGTEFDIEFLYRCLNGDPQKTASMEELTSDFGYLAGVPIWLRFNEHVRYKGTVSQISVQHVMFSENMVPMISKVSLTFLRLPTPLETNDPTQVNDFYTKQFSKTPNYSGAARDTSDNSK